MMRRRITATFFLLVLGCAPPWAVAAPTDISIAEPSPAASAEPTLPPDMRMPGPPSGASTEATPAPSSGNLDHLEYEATENLTAVLIAPAPGGSSDREAAAFEVSTVAGAGIELAIDGSVVEANHIGKRTIDKKTGETHYFFYGVHLKPGPNAVVLTALGASSLRGTPVRAVVYGPGQPVRVEAKLVGGLTADGRTPALFQIQGFDHWNHPALPGSSVHVAIVKGDAHFETVRRASQAELPAPKAGATGVPVSDLAASTIAPNPAAEPTAAARAPSGEAYGEPATSVQPGHDANTRAIADRSSQFQALDVRLLSHGAASLSLVPGLVAGELIVRTTFADSQHELRTYISPAKRKPMLLGLATAGVGSVPGVPGESPDAPGDANSRRGRIALYGVGPIGGNAQATVAYDTAETLAPSNSYGSFADNPGDRPYQTYGDASLQRDDALSSDHLYARIDDNRSSVMWGEFQAQTGGTTGIGGFSELVDGAKLELAGNNAKLTAFQARNDIAYARQIFSPTGLSNLGGLLHSDIVVGSDTVTVVVLYRRTGAVLSQTVLTRNVDYTLDYATGFLRFLNPPLPFDDSFNPQQILITYEYGGPGANAATTGGRFETGFGSSQAVRFGIGYVNDATGGGNLALSNEDLSGTLAGGGWSVGHIATRGVLPGDSGLDTPQLSAGSANGDAYQFALTTALGVNKVDLGFETTSQGFDNPFAGLSTPGLLDYHALFTHPLGQGGTITAGFDHEQNNLASAVNSQSNASVHAKLPLSKRLTATGGVDVRATSAFSASAATAAAATGAIGNQQLNPVAAPAQTSAISLPAYASNGAGSAQAQAGLQYKLNKILTLSANRVSNLGKSQNASQPAETSAELDADISKRGRLFIRQLWADAPTTSFAAATATLTGIDGARSSTAIGIERAIGAATDVDTEYVIDHTASGNDAYAEMGVREKLALGKNLRGEASFQRASTFGGFASGVEGSATTATAPAASAFDIYGLSLAYTLDRFRATGQYLLRTGGERGYTLDLGAAGALSPDVAAFVTSNASNTGSGFNDVDDKATLAYRPSLNDRSVTLFSFEDEDGDVSALATHATILSLEELIRPARRTEIALRYAYKLDGDSYYPARTSLFGVRVDQRITTRVDIAGETRFLTTQDIANASTTALALEAGYRVGDNLRVAGGYNFSGSPDPALIAAPTRRGLYATVTTVFDGIFGWGKDQR